MKIRSCSIPTGSYTHNYLPANYYDSYFCQVSSEHQISPVEIMIAFWTKPPRWVDRLFNLRNTLVKFVGLKGAQPDQGQLADSIRDGSTYNMFSVAYKSEQEVVLKLTDSHLDAYISVYVQPLGDNQYRIDVVTVVHIHNWLGYVYFYPISPFHKLVVKGMIKHIVRNKYY